MDFSRILFYLLFVFSISHAQDRPGDDSDDAIPNCALTCQSGLGSLDTGTCSGSGAAVRSSFLQCARGACTEDDDYEGSDDWLSSTCEDVLRAATASMSASRTSVSVSATTTAASTTMTSVSATGTSSTSASYTGTTSSSASSSTISSTSSSTTSSIASTTSSTATSTATASPGSPGLSTGAKAGIGIGAAIAALLLIAGIIYYCVRRMHRSRLEQKGLWPSALTAWEESKGLNSSTVDGSERGAGGGLAGAAMGASRFEPQDPYSAYRPHPDQPELRGVMRSELHGQPYQPWTEIPQSLRSGPMQEAAPRFELPVEGAALSGPLQSPNRIPRKQPARVVAGDANGVSPSNSVREPGGETLSPVGATTEGARPVSTISNDASDIPLPMSPVSPTLR